MVATIVFALLFLGLFLGGARSTDWAVVDAQVTAAITDPNLIASSYFIEDLISFRYPISRRLTYINLTAADILFVRKPLKAFSAFDWVVYPDSDPVAKVSKVDMPNPSTVLCFPSLLRTLVARLESLPTLSGGMLRSLVIAGGDMKMSSVISDLDVLVTSQKFSGIWFEAKDMEHPHVQTAPNGFLFFYLLRAGVSHVLRALQSATENTHGTRRLVCAAWGRVYGSLDHTVQSRSDLINFLESNVEWVTRSNWSYQEYWENLGNYKFMFVPEGNGVQTPKMYECWLVRTIPITISNFATRDLQRMGYPFVLVDAWSDISSPAQLEALYHEMSQTVDWSEVLRMIHLQSFMDIIRNSSTYKHI